MHYNMYFAGMGNTNLGGDGQLGRPRSRMVSSWEMFRQMLENTPHTFAFIITVDQWEQWEQRILQHNLKQYEIFEMPYFVTNRNHPTARRLRLVILKGKGTDES